MAYDPNILRRAAARLEEQKRQREDRREELRRKAYAREPRLAQLDRQLQRTMAELASASLRQGGHAPDPPGRPGQKPGDPAGAGGAAGGPGPARGRPGRQARLPQVRGHRLAGAQMCECLKKLCAQEQIQELSKLLDLGSSPSTPSAWTITATSCGPAGPPPPGPTWIWCTRCA